MGITTDTVEIASVKTAADMMRSMRDAGRSVVVANPKTKQPYTNLLPIRPDTGRPGWKMCQTEIIGDEVFERWYKADTGAYAVVGGEVSGGLLVIDFDEPGFIERWAEKAGDAPNGLPVQLTQSLNHQLWMLCPNPGRNEKLAFVPDETHEDGRRCAIETRAEGGYAIGPYSFGPSGNMYTPLCDPDLFLNIPFVEQERAEFLLKCARELDECPLSKQDIAALEAAKNAPARTHSYKSNGNPSVIDAFNDAHDIRRVLVDCGYTRQGNRFLRPNPDEDSMPGTIIVEKNGREMSYHYSSNDPLDDRHAHSPFGVWCYWKHKNDVRVAVREAAKRLGMEYKPDDDEPIQSAFQRNSDPYFAKAKQGENGDADPKKASFANFASFAPKTEKQPWPVLREDAFYGLPGEIVRAIDPHTEADPVAVLIQLLVAFGSIIGRSAHYVADASRHYANLYCVLIGTTSKGRKGTSWANVAMLMRSIAPDWLTERVLTGLSSGEGLIWAVRNPIEKRVPVKVKGRITGEYDTEIVDEGITDKRLTVQEGEFASVLKQAAREGNTLSPIVRLAWDTGNLRSLTKNSPAVATDAHISIIGHITRDELLRTFDATEAANGFGNRFLWVCSKRSKCLPEGGEIHTVDFSDIHRRLAAAVENAREATLVTRDAEARAFWAEIYPTISEGKPGIAGAMTSRAESQVMRLALIWGLFDESRVIRLPHLKAALSLWTYCEESIAFIFGSSLGDPLGDEIYRALIPRVDGMTRTDISNHLGRHYDAAKIGRALSTLAERGKAMCRTKETAGRPQERWYAITPKGE